MSIDITDEAAHEIALTTAEDNQARLALVADWAKMDDLARLQHVISNARHAANDLTSAQDTLALGLRALLADIQAAERRLPHVTNMAFDAIREAHVAMSGRCLKFAAEMDEVIGRIERERL
jgi:hypothetical protein